MLFNSIRLDAIRFSCLNVTVMRVNDELKNYYQNFQIPVLETKKCNNKDASRI